MICKTSEQSPVYAYMKRPSMIDFPGRMAVVMFTSGCNFQCGFCHNSSLMAKRQNGLSWETLGETCEHFSEQWVDAAVISGGEPTIDGDGLKALIAFLKERGLAVKLDTNGSRPQILDAVLDDVDYVAMDVKTALSKYREFVGFADTGKILESINMIRDRVPEHEFRTTVIEGVHDESDIIAIAGIVRVAKRYVLQPFIPHDNLPDPFFSKLPRTSPAFMRRMAEAAAGCARELIVRGG